MGTLSIKRFYLWKFLFLCFPLCVLHAQYIDINELLKDEQVYLEWDSLHEKGNIKKQDTVITFKIGTPFLIVNYQRKVTIEAIIRQKGQILIPAAAFTKINALFQEQEALRQALKEVAVIILDPGHGGKDPGAVAEYTLEKGKLVLYEKDVVLKVAFLLEALLKAQYPAKTIILTRSDDRFLKLEERADIANGILIDKNDAILFISLHTNSGFNKKAQGFEVWHLPSTYRRVLLEEEDAAPGEEDLIPILNTMLEEEFLVESVKLADSILKNLEIQVGDVTENRGMKEEAWFVVKKSNMPSLLIELGFLSNKDEATRLNTESYLHKLATGIYNGIIEFITRFESTKGFTE